MEAAVTENETPDQESFKPQSAGYDSRFSEAYSDANFWEKVNSCALAAGAAVIERALSALAANVSQFGRQVDAYDGKQTPEERATLVERLKLRTATDDGRHEERFRREALATRRGC